MLRFSHNYPYDPNYGYSLEDLLRVPAPKPPDDFQAFWEQRYRQALTLNPQGTLSFAGQHDGYQIYDISYPSTGQFLIGGWLLIPENQEIRQGVIVGHGYGGRDQPDYHLRLSNTVLFFPCFRGISRSRRHGVPEYPDQHVLFGIDNPHHYILGGCVEDLWLAVTVLLNLYPRTAGRIGYMGISFGGGIGALALPWDKRIRKAHFNVPTFGNQPLRLSLQTIGSAASVRRYAENHHNILETLAYYDSSSTARFATQPAHFALAMFDPVVAPPGQFAIYNAWGGDKSLFVLEAGHFDYPQAAKQNQQLLTELQQFFG